MVLNIWPCVQVHFAHPAHRPRHSAAHCCVDVPAFLAFSVGGGPSKVFVGLSWLVGTGAAVPLVSAATLTLFLPAFFLLLLVSLLALRTLIAKQPPADTALFAGHSVRSRHLTPATASCAPFALPLLS